MWFLGHTNKIWFDLIHRLALISKTFQQSGKKSSCLTDWVFVWLVNWTQCKCKECKVCPLCGSPTWWYAERTLCISSTSSLEISFTTNVRSYDVSSSPTHWPSSSLSGGLRARDTCWWERAGHVWACATCGVSCTTSAQRNLEICNHFKSYLKFTELFSSSMN